MGNYKRALTNEKAAYCLHVSIALSKSGCKCMCLSISEIFNCG